MSTEFYFDGKKIKLPGSYARVTSGRSNPPLDLDYGNILIIDSLNMKGETYAGMLGGSGVSGENFNGVNSIYKFNTISAFKDFVGTGWWYKAADFLFNVGQKQRGVSNIYVIKPASTTSALMTFTATGGGTAGGSFKVKTLDEGAAANGTVTLDNLVKGYGYTVVSGTKDPAKWIFKIWRSTFRGLYADDIPYDEVLAVNATPELIVSSPEFSNIQELIDWAGEDSIFSAYFKLDPTSAVVGTGIVDAADVLAVAGYQVAAAATTTYDQMTQALEAVRELDFSFVITTYTGTPQADADLLKIKAHINSDAKFDKQLFVYGSDTVLADSVTAAAAMNDEKVILTHGSFYKSSVSFPTGLREWDSFFHACIHLGRLAGLQPQVPMTFKRVGISGLKVTPTIADKETAVAAGILMTIYDYSVNDFVVLQDVNTLQKNKFFLNPDGTSHVIQFVRIKAQLNKELIVNARIELLDDETGVNRSTLSEQNLIDWTKGYLQRKLAQDDADNLILSYQNVTASTVDDVYFVNYEFVPNSEIKAIFFTGYAL